MYSVTISRAAQKEIRSLGASVIPRVFAAIRKLAADPRPPGCKKLVGAENLWRVRVGDYRVVYRIDDAEPSVEVVIVRHRSDVYE